MITEGKDEKDYNTIIQVKKSLANKLISLKAYGKESYQEVIVRLINNLAAAQKKIKEQTIKIQDLEEKMRGE